MPSARSATDDRLPETEPLTWEGDLAARMVEGIRADLLKRTQAARQRRHRRLTITDPPAARRRLARILGVAPDRPAAGELQILSPANTPNAPLARGPSYSVHAVRWPVAEHVDGEGLLLQPDRSPKARVICCPDADHSPEQLAGLDRSLPTRLQWARRLAENGCAVIVPQTIDRDCEHSVVRADGRTLRATNMTHREFIYRAAFELGRHVLGFEIDTVRALLDAWSGSAPCAIVGYGEGGRLALYAAALDERLTACGVSGAFGPRESTWQERVDRNLFGLLREFGDGETAALVAPRSLVIEAAHVPDVGTPPETPGRSGAAPGQLQTPSFADVEAEVDRAMRLTAGQSDAAGFLQLVQPPAARPGSDAFLRGFLRSAGARAALTATQRAPRSQVPSDGGARRDRIVNGWIDHTQRLLANAEHRRRSHWSKADHSSPTAFARSAERYRKDLSRRVIGELPAPRGALRPRSRLVYDTPAFRGYEIVLDVYGKDGDDAHVFSYGILLVPKGIRRNQRRPVVVCQHGLEGRPQDVADPAVDHDAYHTYACRLAERGFVTFAPQNPYIGQARYRDIQRLANPLGLSLFSVVVRQHERILQWLATLPYVDAERIAFYGLSYGGKTAMRVPALLPGYCLSICSADYNEWIWKCASSQHIYSYLGTGEYDMPEFDLGNGYNYAEMSWLIFPRPFMVERGHHDGVAPDEWVAYEYARTRRLYVLQGLSDRTEIEYFDGPHTINGDGTFAFLEKHLR